jgi:hypothetical protein
MAEWAKRFDSAKDDKILLARVSAIFVSSGCSYGVGYMLSAPILYRLIIWSLSGLRRRDLALLSHAISGIF